MTELGQAGGGGVTYIGGWHNCARAHRSARDAFFAIGSDLGALHAGRS